MKAINISNDIIPLGQFKTSISKWLKNIQDTRHPLIITQNGKPAGVLLSPTDYDELVYKERFLISANQGLADAEAGRVYTTEALRQELTRRRAQRKAK